MRISTAIAILLLVLLTVSDTQGGAGNDTFYVSGKAVVYFGPTQAEYDSLSEEEKAEMDEVLSDFYHYRQEVIPFLKSNQIQEFLTASPRSRSNFQTVTVALLPDGNQEPKVFLGVATDVDLISMFKDYFGLE